MRDSANRMDEESMKERLKLAYKPVVASSQFKEALQKRLAQEAQEQASQKPRRVLPRWLVWVPAAAALALLLAIVLIPILSPATGTLEISVPETNIAGQPSSGRTISAIYVTVTRIDAHKANGASGDNGTWITVLDKPQTVNLLDRAGVHELVASMKVPAGQYTQIRVETGGGNAIADGEEVPLELASTFDVSHPFSVEEGMITALSINFDVSEPNSIVDEGNVIALRPQLIVEVTQKE